MPNPAATLDAALVDEMIKGREKMLAAIGGGAMGMLATAIMLFAVGTAGFHPMTTFAAAFFLFLISAGLSMWSYGEYLTLSSIDERRREAGQG